MANIKRANTSGITKSGVAIPDVPDAPTICAATNVGTSRAFNNGSATVAFTAAATGGTSTSFTATSTPGSFTATGAGSPLTVTGLQSATSYTFAVTGTNASATGAASAASSSITATTVPATMTAPTPTNVGTSRAFNDGAASVAFTAPATGGVVGNSTTSSNTSNTNGQIPFPATQNPSADVNTLDDYEEGSYTPTVTGFSSVAQTPTIYYVKVGKLVTLSASAFASGTSNSTANKTFTGMPSSLYPTTEVMSLGVLYDNGTIAVCNIEISTAGIISFIRALSAGGTSSGTWTASGTTQLKMSTISYTI
jgi:hypothetical protein